MNLSRSSFTPGSTSWFGPVVQYVTAFAPPHRVFHAPRAEQVPLLYWKSPRPMKLSSDPSFRLAVMLAAFLPDADEVDVFPSGFMSPTAANSNESVGGTAVGVAALSMSVVGAATALGSPLTPAPNKTKAATITAARSDATK